MLLTGLKHSRVVSLAVAEPGRWTGQGSRGGSAGWHRRWPEDPVYGRMSASVAQWLISAGAVPSIYRAAQGGRLGRAGTIEITSDADGTVWVGGATTTYLYGIVRCASSR